jgi:hypothetical protein
MLEIRILPDSSTQGVASSYIPSGETREPRLGDTNPIRLGYFSEDRQEQQLLLLMTIMFLIASLVEKKIMVIVTIHLLQTVESQLVKYYPEKQSK